MKYLVNILFVLFFGSQFLNAQETIKVIEITTNDGAVLYFESEVEKELDEQDLKMESNVNMQVTYVSDKDLKIEDWMLDTEHWHIPDLGTTENEKIINFVEQKTLP